MQSCQPCATPKRNHDGKKRNFRKKKRNSLKRNLQPRATHFHAEISIPYAIFSIQADILLWFILVLSVFHSFWEYFSLQVYFQVCFNLLNLWSNQHFRAVVWCAVCKKKIKKIKNHILWRKNVLWYVNLEKKSLETNFSKNGMVGSSVEIICALFQDNTT